MHSVFIRYEFYLWLFFAVWDYVLGVTRSPTPGIMESGSIPALWFNLVFRSFGTKSSSASCCVAIFRTGTHRSDYDGGR